MATLVSQWGNSLGVRLPKILSEKLNLKKGTEVSLYEEEGKIVIEKRKTYTLSQLLEGAPTCPYGEIDTSNPTGREEW